jgi:serine/threonine-protein kinase
MDLVLRFDTRESSYFDLKLSAIFTGENWATIAKVTNAHAPHVSIDGQIGGALAISSTNTSYTELWLESLAKPPSDEAFIPLEDKIALLDGRYIINSKLASGGQGHVYAAVEQRTGQEVVLKEYLLPVYVDEAARNLALAQFESEVSLLKQLSHPQIVKLIDYFAEQNRAFLVLNHIKGVTLKEFVKVKGPLPSVAVVKLLRQMCDILGYLHGRSPAVVHRDFTPDNLLVDADLNVTLIDFTIAQTAHGSNQAGAGKVAYMPPEQYRGEILAQSDIYAMGATIFYCITGYEPEPLRQLVLSGGEPAIPAALCDAVFQATAQDLESRTKSVDEVLHLLDKLPVGDV